MENIDLASIKRSRGLILVLLVVVLAILQYHFISQKWVSRGSGRGEILSPGESVQPNVQFADSGVVHPVSGRAS